MRKPKIYLAGRMDHDNDCGSEWRTALTPFLEKLGFEILNPYEFEPKKLTGARPGRLPKGFKHWYELRNSENPSHVRRFLRYMRRIIKFDLGVIRNEADYVIVKWDKGCRDGAGTHSEMTLAWDLGKPVYCVKEARLPGWAQACCEEVFDSFDELKEFLDEEFGQDEAENLELFEESSN